MHPAQSPAAREAATGAAPAPVIPQTYYTVNQLADLEPALGVGAIRDDLFHRRSNGLEASGAVLFRGRRILLHRERYLAWLEAQSRRSAS